MRNYVTGGDLRKRLERLERRLLALEIDWGEQYDLIMEMDRTMNPPNPASPVDDFEQRFIEQNGTRESFIETQIELHKKFYQ